MFKCQNVCKELKFAAHTHTHGEGPTSKDQGNQLQTPTLDTESGYTSPFASSAAHTERKRDFEKKGKTIISYVLLDTLILLTATNIFLKGILNLLKVCLKLACFFNND